MTRPMWINGEFVAGSASSSIEVLNPYTEELLDRVPAGTPQDVERELGLVVVGAIPPAD